MGIFDAFCGLQSITLVLDPEDASGQAAEEKMVQDMRALGCRPWVLQYVDNLGIIHCGGTNASQ